MQTNETSSLFLKMFWFFFRAGCGLMMCFSPTAPKSQEVEEQFLPKSEQG